MKLDGKEIANSILSNLKQRVKALRSKGIIPTLLIILVGDNEQSLIYIRQKELKAKEIGARTEVLTLSESTTFDEAKSLVTKLNSDPQVQAIIIQRPAPESLRVEELSKLIDPEKEIDGFGKNSFYKVPVAEATEILIKNAFEQMNTSQDFNLWIKKQKIVVTGKGETAGRPVIQHLKNLGSEPTIIDSKTEDPKTITKKADILISAVGKDRVVTADMVKKGAILIGVGLHTDEEGKLRGDFHRDEIAEIVSFYSPTPGGVGPVNVACLMRNLVKAAEKGMATTLPK
ncbi:MAG: Bifunctional protein FolD [Candidatus Levybacteria bacterium GW2011_GWA2_40_8]|nr:MAG: Bifunctional protein FolD [Candidatus Levybacteria bacterium GW2011_GWA2_40_8]